MPIPRTTFEIWHQGWDALPKQFYENVKALHRLNPEWEHVKLADADLRRECYAYSRACGQTYDNFQIMHQKIDFGRYATLFNRGGMSIDVDMIPLKPLDDLPGLDGNDCIMSFGPGSPVENWIATGFKLPHFVNNAAIACVPNSKVMKYLIDSIIDKVRKMEPSPPPKEKSFEAAYLVGVTTGPLSVTEILFDKFFPPDLLLMDHQYLEPCSGVDVHCRPTSKSIVNHANFLSWLPDYIREIFRAYYFVKPALLYLAAGLALWLAWPRISGIFQNTTKKNRG